jgi:hypothetical protein
MHVCYAENCAVQCMENICFCQIKNHTLQVGRAIYLRRPRSPATMDPECGHGLQFYEELPSVIGRGSNSIAGANAVRQAHALGRLSSDRYDAPQKLGE